MTVTVYTLCVRPIGSQGQWKRTANTTSHPPSKDEIMEQFLAGKLWQLDPSALEAQWQEQVMDFNEQEPWLTPHRP